MGFKNLKYGDGRWFFVRAIMDEHLHKLLDRSYHVKEFKKTEFVGEARAAIFGGIPAGMPHHAVDRASAYVPQSCRCHSHVHCAPAVDACSQAVSMYYPALSLPCFAEVEASGMRGSL